MLMRSPNAFAPPARTGGAGALARFACGLSPTDHRGDRHHVAIWGAMRSFPINVPAAVCVVSALVMPALWHPSPLWRPNGGLSWHGLRTERARDMYCVLDVLA